jgi:hypothetical protein
MLHRIKWRKKSKTALERAEAAARGETGEEEEEEEESDSDDDSDEEDDSPSAGSHATRCRLSPRIPLLTLFSLLTCCLNVKFIFDIFIYFHINLTSDIS